MYFLSSPLGSVILTLDLLLAFAFLFARSLWTPGRDILDRKAGYILN